jgi:hypothetical protein
MLAERGPMKNVQLPYEDRLRIIREGIAILRVPARGAS